MGINNRRSTQSVMQNQFAKPWAKNRSPRSVAKSHTVKRRHKLLISATDMSLAVALGQAFDDQTVSVVTSDGKVLVGTLKGMDNKANLILNDSHERVFSEDQGVEKHHLGLCVIRGENVTLIGQVDRDIDHQLDLAQTKAKPLKPVKH